MPKKIEKPRKFEEYLQDKHAAQYQGLDDEMPDNFNEWLEDMGPDEMIEYADKWHDTYLYVEAISNRIKGEVEWWLVKGKHITLTMEKLLF